MTAPPSLYLGRVAGCVRNSLREALSGYEKGIILIAWFRMCTMKQTALLHAAAPSVGSGKRLKPSPAIPERYSSLPDTYYKRV